MSLHFKRYEFACKCGCGFAAMDEELIGVLEDVRKRFKSKPVTITSGCRCATHNFKVGGQPDSYHIRGMAADFRVKGIDPSAVSEYLRSAYPGIYGIGQYPSWTHIDVRPDQEARWYET